MNAWKHSLSSSLVFGGQPEDYLAVHQLLDGSKLFFYDARHRILLHHLFGMEIAEEVFGATTQNSDGQHVPIREIVAMHLREDLSKRTPSLEDWFAKQEPRLGKIVTDPIDLDEDIEAFIKRPWMRSGLRSTMLITFSHFGVYLAELLHGVRFAVRLAEVIPKHHSLRILMSNVKLQDKWQYTIDHTSVERVDRYELARGSETPRTCNRGRLSPHA